jgi:hypothetical protein
MENHFPLAGNRLSASSSPYLLQHASNPVNWQPWDEQALAMAFDQKKPILLSIGYSTCHWCHVMAHECFENQAIAAIMNRHFVCIKVDREQRPDLDRIYMNAVTALTGAGGWPLNVFLTPSAKPFFGGTYFPPQSRMGISGWPDLLTAVAKAWDDPNQRAKIHAAAEAVTQTIGSHLYWQDREAALDPGLIETARRQFAKAYDPNLGGFGTAPKFPNPGIICFLLECPEPRPAAAPSGKAMAVHSLRAMARGGIFDHIGGGFHRYSTDARWHVPHFEKMLYDNAQLLDVYLRAYLADGDPVFEKVVRKTADYVIRDLSLPEGGFCAAEDADSPGMDGTAPAEGAFYLWSWDQIRSILPLDIAEIFAYRFGVLPDGNARSDPHGFFKGKNVLFQAHDIEQCARHFGLDAAAARQRLDQAQKVLFAQREKRARPHRDAKVITSWNGLMIGALARAAKTLGQPSYLQAAQKAARFIHAHLYRPESRRLRRCWYNGLSAHEALATDYAGLAGGVLALHAADGDPFWRDWAVELTDEMLNAFADPHGGLLYGRRDDGNRLIARIKEDADNVTPSAASVAALNLISLGRALNRRDYQQAAVDIVCAVQPRIRQNPTVAPVMLTALDQLTRPGSSSGTCPPS